MKEQILIFEKRLREQAEKELNDLSFKIINKFKAEITTLYLGAGHDNWILTKNIEDFDKEYHEIAIKRIMECKIKELQNASESMKWLWENGQN